MRRFNAVLTALILLLFLVHGILAGFQLMGPGNTTAKTIAWIALALIGVHTVIGVKYTIDTLRVRRKSGISYLRENTLFWARRVSGFAVLALLAFHLTAFGDSSGGAYRLKPFNAPRLAAQLLLVAALALHILSNVRPSLIAFGIRSLKPRIGDILFVLSAVLLFCGAAFVVYYLRWNTI